MNGLYIIIRKEKQLHNTIKIGTVDVNCLGFSGLFRDMEGSKLSSCNVIHQGTGRSVLFIKWVNTTYRLGYEYVQARLRIWADPERYALALFLPYFLSAATVNQGIFLLY
jgi:hypothetical protein